MPRLILTTSGAGLPAWPANPTDLVLSFDQPYDRRFVWGPLPSPGELALGRGTARVNCAVRLLGYDGFARVIAGLDPAIHLLQGAVDGCAGQARA